ncbi:HprK-related kinase B [Desulfocurvus sp.]|uniref:HprK-related kinase B n=1 Tax=Desulfocurvus sp. TaxID=2871698 RepID=UPI0025C41B89|nr:HprK-related kinase B [Desulfocurvus sp.]MCK9240961.1 HprK-related kinase B [Desulfocurvus sp.]
MSVPARPASVGALAASVRAALPAEHTLFLALGDCVVEVRASRADLREALAGYFNEFLCPPPPPGAADILVTAHEAPAPELDLPLAEKAPDPGKAKVKEQWADLPDGRVVRKRLTGMVFAFGGGVNVAVGPCLDNPNQVVNFVNNRFIEGKLDAGCLLGHAAGVALGGRGLALAGFSGMGKSTLALHLMSRGTDFVSNDRVLLREEPGGGATMFGVAKHPRINPGTALANPDLADIVAPGDRGRFLALPEAELWALEHKYDALIGQCFGPGRFRLRAPMDGLALLNWQRGAGPMRARLVDPARRTDLLPAFMKATGLFYRPADPARPQDPPMSDYVRALSRCAVIELAGGVDFDAAADVCLEFLKTGATPGAQPQA